VSPTCAANALPLAFALERSGGGTTTARVWGLVRSFSSELIDVDARVFMWMPLNLPHPMLPTVSVRFRAPSPKAPAAEPGIVFGILTAPSHNVPFTPNGNSMRSAPFQVNALTWMFFPPRSVSNVTTMSPTLRRGRVEQLALAEAVVALSWLNS